ncbi:MULTISPECIES: hypothetical protein [Enterobacter cloacae complex]|uniref:hypothetical protein n=1 Tax=Enterobacter cloacae complex TaxID=354276 RepID=UPI00100F30D5|nr:MULTISPECIES: hypothetical protein [Enterobacter cloacae complex]RYA49989.1 hypothetical protein DD597_15470 [Enterobacter cloacae complex sp. 677-3DZ2D5B]RYA64795.1 hypothetical protein DD599_11440 [Enterobacter cloacae complex sp. CH23B]RYA71751.1 hypothetical protein DD598_06820 [Enterobacter cloacae complex sp. 2DZ2F16B1]
MTDESPEFSAIQKQRSTQLEIENFVHALLIKMLLAKLPKTEQDSILKIVKHVVGQATEDQKEYKDLAMAYLDKTFRIAD